jgi:hypothetical protein
MTTAALDLGPAAWVAKHTYSYRGSVAAGKVALASALDELRATGVALAAGVVSAEHASVIVAATRAKTRLRLHDNHDDAPNLGDVSDYRHAHGQRSSAGDSGGL